MHGYAVFMLHVCLPACLFNVLVLWCCAVFRLIRSYFGDHFTSGTRWSFYQRFWIKLYKHLYYANEFGPSYILGWSLFCNFWNLHFSPSNCVPLCKKTYLVKYKFNWTIFRGSSMSLKFHITCILISSRQITILWKIYCLLLLSVYNIAISYSFYITNC